MKDKGMPKADFAMGLILMACSLVIVVESLKIPRFEKDWGGFYAAPGFVPLILGITLFVMSLALFVLVGWAVPSLTQVSLGFDAQGQPLPPVSPAQLFLLPALNLILLIASYMVSVWYYRTKKGHPFVTALWGANAFTAVLFLTAVLFILAAS